MAKQIAAFSVAVAQRIIRAVRLIESINGPDVVREGDRLMLVGAEARRGGAGGAVQRTFLAFITGHVAFAGNVERWKYAWSEAELAAANTVSVKSGGRSGTVTTDYALNLAETPNLAGEVGGDGVDIGSADYPAGFRRQPIGGNGESTRTHAVNVPVLMQIVRDSAGATRYIFSQANGHSGTCA